MVHVVKGTVAAQRKHSSDIEQCLDSWATNLRRDTFHSSII
jgi:hypothetical protein